MDNHNLSMDAVLTSLSNLPQSVLEVVKELTGINVKPEE